MARFCYEPPTESCRLVSALCRPGGCLLSAFSLPCASWTHSMHNSIHTRPARLSNLSSINHFELEARVGIGQVWPLSAVSNPHPQRLRHQRHAASCASNIPIIKDFRRFVKLRHYAPNTNQLLTKYSFTTRSLALSLALFIEKTVGKSNRIGLN